MINMVSRNGRGYGSRCGVFLHNKRGGSNNCLNRDVGNTFSGMQWYYANIKRRDLEARGALEQRGERQECIEPDLYGIDGKYYRVNTTMPKELKNLLLKRLDGGEEDGQARSALPAELSEWEVDYDA